MNVIHERAQKDVKTQSDRLRIVKLNDNIVRIERCVV